MRKLSYFFYLLLCLFIASCSNTIEYRDYTIDDIDDAYKAGFNAGYKSKTEVVMSIDTLEDKWDATDRGIGASNYCLDLLNSN